jgi:hypothetical protein
MIEKFDIRWATEADALELARLSKEAGIDLGVFELDWTNPGMTWLVAVDEDGKGLAAIQVMAGYPMGRIETLMVDGELGKKQRGVVVRDITDRATAILRVAGCQVVSSSIPTSLESYLEVATHRGWVEWDTAHLIMKRLV